MKLTLSFGIALLLIQLASFAFGQGEQDKLPAQKETAEVVAAKKSLTAFAGLLKESKWDELKTQMSEKGQSSLILEVCYSLAVGQEIEMGGEGDLPPGLMEIVEKIDSVKNKYELEEIASLMFDGETEKALQRLDATGKKWEIVDAIWKAQSGSPFHMHPAIGTVESFEIDSEKIYLDVKMAPISDRPQSSDDDVEIMMDGPPQVVRMTKSKGVWKYDGVDEERTMAKMEKFMAEFGMNGFGEMEPPELLADPSFTGTATDDTKIKLADYKGKIVVLDFWGTWCGPCVAAMPSLKLIREAFKDHGVEIIGIASDEKAAVREFCKKNGIEWPNIVDADGRLANQFGVQAFPTLMVIGKDGRHVHSDIQKNTLVDDLIERLGLDRKDFAELKAKLKEAAKGENSKPAADDTQRKSDS